MFGLKSTIFLFLFFVYPTHVHGLFSLVFALLFWINWQYLSVFFLLAY